MAIRVTPAGHPLALALLKAFRLVGEPVTKLSIHIGVDEVMTVEVTRNVFDFEADEMRKVMQTYNLPLGDPLPERDDEPAGDAPCIPGFLDPDEDGELTPQERTGTGTLDVWGEAAGAFGRLIASSVAFLFLPFVIMWA